MKNFCLVTIVMASLTLSGCGTNPQAYPTSGIAAGCRVSTGAAPGSLAHDGLLHLNNFAFWPTADCMPTFGNFTPNPSALVTAPSAAEALSVCQSLYPAFLTARPIAGYDPALPPDSYYCLDQLG